jgi:hypothetical protein
VPQESQLIPVCVGREEVFAAAAIVAFGIEEVEAAVETEETEEWCG